MNLIKLTKQFPVSKTICFEAKPVGKTAENIEKYGYLDHDKIRASNCVVVKKLIDKYNKKFIERVLPLVRFEDGDLEKYADLYFNRKERNAEYIAMQKYLRGVIVEALKNDAEYSFLFRKDFFKALEETKKNKENNKTDNGGFPEYTTTDEEWAVVSEYLRFITYFSAFFDKRENMYTAEAKSTGIANRIVNENMPRFFENAKVATKVFEQLPQDVINEVNDDFSGIYGLTVQDITSIEYAGSILSQEQIDVYNNILGGYTTSDGHKIQGINEKINLYNQKNKTNVPLFKRLYKQILSEHSSLSYIPDVICSDNEAINAINDHYNSMIETFEEAVLLLKDVNPSEVFVSDKSIEQVAKGAFGIGRSENTESIEKKQKKYSLNELNNKYSYVSAEERCFASVEDYISAQSERLLEKAKDAYAQFASEVKVPYKGKVKLAKDDKCVELIKNLMDALKCFQVFIKQFVLEKNDKDASSEFYVKYNDLYKEINCVDKMYNKIRNYITKKPYSDEKIRITFDKPTLLNGWDTNKEIENCNFLMTKDGKYYLGIINNKKEYRELLVKDAPGEHYNKMIYKQIPGAKKYLTMKQVGPQNPPAEIKDILQKPDKLRSSEERCKLIEYFQTDFLAHYDKIFDENGSPYFVFDFRDPSDYGSMDEFYEDVDNQGYAVKFSDVPCYDIDRMVEKGDIFLFEIYSKDFSDYSKGTPNLHTLFLKMLLDQRNLEKGIIKLCGMGSMYYRPASLDIKETTVHPANEPINNKNKSNPKKASTFTYDIIKDRRYTKPQYQIHLPIKINQKKKKMLSKTLNETVRTLIAETKNQYIIGIDRGERNLLYISAIDEKGNIVEQKSLNILDGIDYKRKLVDISEEMIESRKSWKTIGKIADTKDGYLDKAVDEICKLVVKYGAVIVMEDLTGLKKARACIETAIYQRFETKLANKLSCVIDKTIDPEAEGGILCPYQLAMPADAYKDLRGQNGIIFFVPAWKTSKIDPTTGFVDLIYPKYKSVTDSKDFVKKIKSIQFDSKNNYFVFSLCFADFDKKDKSKKIWEICTFGDRIEDVKNSGGYWDKRVVSLTKEFISLFNRYGIDYSKNNLKEQILSQSDKSFFKSLLYLLSLVLQLRNSESASKDSSKDYILSPVKNANGEFFDSRCAKAEFPIDADANGAFNIARKGQMIVKRLQSSKDSGELLPKFTYEDWLNFAQTNICL